MYNFRISNTIGLKAINCFVVWMKDYIETITYSLKTYICLFISQKGQNWLQAWEKDRNERCRHRLTEDSDYYIDPYLLNHIDSIFRALHLDFLDKKFLTGFCRGVTWPPPPLHTRWPLFELLEFMTNWLTTYVYIISQCPCVLSGSWFT